MPKFVASRTLQEPLTWNGTLLKGELEDAVAKLKAERGGDLITNGCGELTRNLLAAGLVDEFWFSLHPAVWGKGERPFWEGEAPADAARDGNVRLGCGAASLRAATSVRRDLSGWRRRACCPGTTSSATTNSLLTSSPRPRKIAANTTVRRTPVPTIGATTLTRPRSSASKSVAGYGALYGASGSAARWRSCKFSPNKSADLRRFCKAL